MMSPDHIHEGTVAAWVDHNCRLYAKKWANPPRI